MSVIGQEARYYSAVAKMQSGVAFEIGKGGAELVVLLVEKGVTLEEYWEKAADAMEREVERYKARIKKRLGGKTDITLGEAGLGQREES